MREVRGSSPLSPTKGEWCKRERPRENLGKAMEKLTELRAQGRDPNQQEEIRNKIALKVSQYQQRKRGDFMEVKTCKECHSVFTETRGKHFCSVACYDVARKKGKQSEDT